MAVCSSCKLASLGRMNRTGLCRICYWREKKRKLYESRSPTRADGTLRQWLGGGPPRPSDLARARAARARENLRVSAAEVLRPRKRCYVCGHLAPGHDEHCPNAARPPSEVPKRAERITDYVCDARHDFRSNLALEAAICPVCRSRDIRLAVIHISPDLSTDPST